MFRISDSKNTKVLYLMMLPVVESISSR